MNELVQDIRYTVRQLRKSPGFTAIAILTVILGIGENAAIYSILHGALQLAYPNKRTSGVSTRWQRLHPSGSPAGLRPFGSFSSIPLMIVGVLAGTGSSTLRACGGATVGHPVWIEAGRRVDAPDAQTERFPPFDVIKVRERIRELLLRDKPSAVVCSGACGADLLLLEVAGKMRIQRLVLLPSDPEIFRQTSVTDRPGNWGELYDEVLKTATVEKIKVPEGQDGYLQTNLMLLDRGADIACVRGVPTRALVV